MYIYIYPQSPKGILCLCFDINPILRTPTAQPREPREPRMPLESRYAKVPAWLMLWKCNIYNWTSYLIWLLSCFQNTLSPQVRCRTTDDHCFFSSHEISKSLIDGWQTTGWALDRSSNQSAHARHFPLHMPYAKKTSLIRFDPRSSCTFHFIDSILPVTAFMNITVHVMSMFKNISRYVRS